MKIGKLLIIGGAVLAFFLLYKKKAYAAKVPKEILEVPEIPHEESKLPEFTPPVEICKRVKFYVVIPIVGVMIKAIEKIETVCGSSLDEIQRKASRRASELFGGIPFAKFEILG